jgi:hypothetical protein
MVMSPLVSKNIYKSITPLFETLYNFAMEWSSLHTCLTLVSCDARFVGSVWLCVMHWPGVTMIDFKLSFLCVGMIYK